MGAEIIDLKPAQPPTIARLRNVELFGEALAAAATRAQHLPGIVVFHGPSGFGKTFAATYAANIFRAFYVEARSTWTRRALCLAILQELGVTPAQRVYEMAAQISAKLLASARPLIIDEADHVLASGSIEVIRDIHEASGAAIALIGEERLPAKLRSVERVHNRVLRWVAAAPIDLDDARELAAIYCRGFLFRDDLLADVMDACRGSARRLCINLDLIRNAAAGEQPDRLDRDWWGGRALHAAHVEPRADAWGAQRRGRT
jgi:DNA transposition AAA+ family ATPase